MATYYVRRGPSPISRASSSRSNDTGNIDEPNDEPTFLDGITPDHSIYIFPNPSSTPLTPIPQSPRSSLFSAPTDLESSESFSFGSRSRTTSNAPSTAVSLEGGGQAIRRRTSQITEDEVEIDVELWTLSTDSDILPDASDSDSSWVLEGEIERVGAGNINLSFFDPGRQPRRPHRLLSPDSDHSQQQYWAVSPLRRSRTHSRVRTISSLSSFSPSPTRRTPANPRVHIPLLSFFSSLLSVDLDDPALRLLTHTDPGEPESILFPGHTAAQLRACDVTPARKRHPGDDVDADIDVGADAEETDTDSAGASTADEVHGLPKLLLASLSDQSTVALRSLRAGLAVYIARVPDVGLPVPQPPTWLGLWRVVGDVCARGGQALKEVWGGERRPVAS